MSLSRKHFQALADDIRVETQSARTIMVGDFERTGMLNAISGMKWEIARMLEKTNPNFDRARFLAACEPSEKE